MKIAKNNTSHADLVKQIRALVNKAQENIARNINKEILLTYWQVGKHIVEFEQKGKIKAEYGKALLLNLSKVLSLELGKGFSRSNLTYMRLFYQKFPKSETVSHKLSWSHYIELLKIENELERNFYLTQTSHENWTVRELKRQKATALFQRLALSKDKKEVLNLSKRGQNIEKEMNVAGDKPPIGIILSAEKDSIMVEYALHGISNKIFVSKYQLYLPDKKLLQQKLHELFENNSQTNA